jgi:ribosomal protein S18 acetylase RimI-like enzyme
MHLKFVIGSPAQLHEILCWLKEEDERGDEGFYCKAEEIAEFFAEHKAVCALAENTAVGFAVFYVAPPASGLSIIEVHPNYRNRGIGRRLLTETLKRLRQRGAQYVKADCTSAAGEALCRAVGFQTRAGHHPTQIAAVVARLRLDLPPTRVAHGSD